MKREDRAQSCRDMLAENVTYTEISRRLRMSSATISAISRGETGFKESGPGRPRKVTPEMRHFIDVNLSLDATITDAIMTRMVNDHFGVQLGVTTIRRCRHCLGYHYRPPKVKQELTEVQKTQRLEFCYWVLSHQEEVENAIFSDESRFQLGPDNRWRRIKRGVTNETCFVSRNKFPLSVMVWGAIGKGFRSKLVMCSNSEDSEEYVQILEKSDLISEADKVYGQGCWCLVQDGASCHRSRRALDWLDKRRVSIVPGWPPNSPDLNPIEMVWGVMKKKIQWGNEKKTREEMFTKLQRVWEDVARESIDSLVSSFIHRCQMVVDAAGDSISGYLSSHRVPTPVITAYRRWDENEDDQLKKLHHELGPRWQSISRATGRPPLACKSRFHQLQQIDLNRHYRDVPLLPPVIEFVEPGCLDVWLTEMASGIDDFLTPFAGRPSP